LEREVDDVHVDDCGAVRYTCSSTGGERKEGGDEDDCGHNHQQEHAREARSW
jgi:hypothetical protein